MRREPRRHDADGLAALDERETRILDPAEERQVLQTLAECKAKLAEALAQVPGAEVPEGADQTQAAAQFMATAYRPDGPAEVRLGAIFHRYSELRTRLALANLRLVAHVAKQFRDRGVAYSDLMQEGFCGLLEAIDRFDLGHTTKLATYATWWIRQAMQRAVAAGAYPVRLTPRHLRQLARSQEGLGLSDQRPEPESPDAPPTTEMIRHIQMATRPTISLDATLDQDSNFRLQQTINDPEGDRTGVVDTDETIDQLLQVLRPREQQVVCLRFGLGGSPRLSLSQVGKVLAVSKERVRQIQDRALQKLRAVAEESHLADALATGP